MLFLDIDDYVATSEVEAFDEAMREVEAEVYYSIPRR